MVKSRKPKSPTPCLSTVLWSPASFIHLDIFSYYLLLVFGIFIALCKMTKLFVVPSPPRCNFLMITDKHKCPSMKLITLCGCQLSIFLMDISKKFAFYYRFRGRYFLLISNFVFPRPLFFSAFLFSESCTWVKKEARTLLSYSVYVAKRANIVLIGCGRFAFIGMSCKTR